MTSASASLPPRRRGGGLTLLRIALFLVVVGVAAWLVTLAAIFLVSRSDQAHRADVIVVLGAAQYDGKPSPVLRARLDHALALYRKGTARRMIMTGGRGAGDTVTEAVVSARYVVKRGVPADAVLTERAGLTSLESMQGVAGLMRRHEMDSAVLVSDPFHMLRLRLLALRVGIQAYTSPTRSSPIVRNSPQERRYMLRESFSLPLSLVESGR